MKGESIITSQLSICNFQPMSLIAFFSTVILCLWILHHV